MALLVFLAFMAMITNSYVPAWMLDNERAHMNEVIDQFGQLKGKVDSMVVEMNVKGTSVTKMYAPIALGSAGVPLFAVPTAGILRYNPMGSGTTGTQVEFNYTANSASQHMLITGGGGKVELEVPNRYYVQQTVAYENGAIVVKQGDNSTIRAYPGLTMYYTGSDASRTVHIGYTEIDMIGTNESIAGSDAAGLNIELVNIYAQSYTVSDGVCRISFITVYDQAWKDYIADMMVDTGIDYTISEPYQISDGVYKIDLTVHSTNGIVVDYNRATVSMDMLS
jgi:hypothetical protein